LDKLCRSCHGNKKRLPIPIFLAYLVPLDVDVTGNITAKISEVWSELKIFCTLVIMATVAILILVERDKPKQSESVGQTLPQLPWKQKKGDLKKKIFLSSNFMKIYRDIHRNV
jgi:hypothetical protein